MNNGRGAINQTVIQQSKQLFGRAQQESDAGNILRLQTADSGIAGKYPIQLGSADPEDVRIALRQNVVKKDGQVEGMGIAIAGDREFDYLQRKKEDVFYSQFLAYINAQADLGNPASAAWWFERFPFLKEKRLEEINRESEKQKRLAQIQVTGPQNEDDFFLMYMLQQGLIAKPTKPLTEMYSEARYNDNTTNFNRGLFSPLSRAPTPEGLPKVLTGVPTWRNPLLQPDGSSPNGRWFGNSEGGLKGRMPGIPNLIGQLYMNPGEPPAPPAN